MQQDALQHQSADTANTAAAFALTTQGQTAAEHKNNAIEDDGGVGPLDPDYEWNAVPSPESPVRPQPDAGNPETDTAAAKFDQAQGGVQSADEADLNWQKQSLETENLADGGHQSSNQKSGQGMAQRPYQQRVGHSDKWSPQNPNQQRQPYQKRDNYNQDRHQNNQGGKWVGNQRGGRGNYHQSFNDRHYQQQEPDTRGGYYQQQQHGGYQDQHQRYGSGGYQKNNNSYGGGYNNFQQRGYPDENGGRYGGAGDHDNRYGQQKFSPPRQGQHQQHQRYNNNHRDSYNQRQQEAPVRGVNYDNYYEDDRHHNPGQQQYRDDYRGGQNMRGTRGGDDREQQHHYDERYPPRDNQRRYDGGRNDFDQQTQRMGSNDEMYERGHHHQQRFEDNLRSNPRQNMGYHRQQDIRGGVNHHHQAGSKDYGGRPGQYDHHYDNRSNQQYGQQQQPGYQRQMSAPQENSHYRQIRRSRSRSPPMPSSQMAGGPQGQQPGWRKDNMQQPQSRPCNFTAKPPIQKSQSYQPPAEDPEYQRRQGQNPAPLQGNRGGASPQHPHAHAEPSICQQESGKDDQPRQYKSRIAPTRELEIVLRSPTPPNDQIAPEERPRNFAPPQQQQRDQPQARIDSRQLDIVEAPNSQGQEADANSPGSPNSHNQNNCNVYIAGIPRRANEDTLRKVFSSYGSIKSVNVIKDHQTGNSRGFAYIRFARQEDALKAIEEMDGKCPFNDWQIKVELAKRGKPFENNNKNHQGDGLMGGGNSGKFRHYNHYNQDGHEQNDYRGGDNTTHQGFTSRPMGGHGEMPREGGQYQRYDKWDYRRGSPTEQNNSKY